MALQKLDVEYVAHVRHFIWLVHIFAPMFPDYILNFPHPLLFSKLLWNDRLIPRGEGKAGKLISTTAGHRATHYMVQKATISWNVL